VGQNTIQTLHACLMIHDFHLLKFPREMDSESDDDEDNENIMKDDIAEEQRKQIMSN
jgi:hypothetical protein